MSRKAPLKVGGWCVRRLAIDPTDATRSGVNEGKLSAPWCPATAREPSRTDASELLVNGLQCRAAGLGIPSARSLRWFRRSPLSREVPYPRLSIRPRDRSRAEGRTPHGAEADSRSEPNRIRVRPWALDPQWMMPSQNRMTATTTITTIQPNTPMNPAGPPYVKGGT
jgi:hypothetical protein